MMPIKILNNQQFAYEVASGCAAHTSHLKKLSSSCLTFGPATSGQIAELEEEVRLKTLQNDQSLEIKQQMHAQVPPPPPPPPIIIIRPVARGASPECIQQVLARTRDRAIPRAGAKAQKIFDDAAACSHRQRPSASRRGTAAAVQVVA